MQETVLQLSRMGVGSSLTELVEGGKVAGAEEGDSSEEYDSDTDTGESSEEGRSEEGGREGRRGEGGEEAMVGSVLLLQLLIRTSHRRQKTLQTLQSWLRRERERRRSHKR